MKILKVLISIVVILGAVYGGYIAYARFWPQKKAVSIIPTTVVQKGEFIIKVTEIGKVKAKKSVQVSAPFSGKIIKLASEGTLVKEGDFLAQLDTTENERKQRDESIDYEQAMADVNKSEEELKIMKISAGLDLQEKTAMLEYEKSELEDARSQSKRQQRLFKEQIVTRQAVEDAENKVRSTELAVKKGTIAVEVTRKKNLSDEKKKQAEIKIYKLKAKKKFLDLDKATFELNNATIKAPEAGIIVHLDIWRAGQMSKVSEGDEVHNRQEIIEIPDLSSLQVIVPVRETDIHRVKVGEKTIIKLEANPDLAIYGKVVTVARLAKEPRVWENPTAPGQKTFDVTIDLVIKDTDDTTIRPGMTANVDIIEKQIMDSHSLPLECVFFEEGKKFVYIKQGEEFKRREVEVGERNENFVVITRGIEEGEEVALRDPTKSIEEADVSSQKEKNENSSPMEMIPGQ